MDAVVDQLVDAGSRHVKARVGGSVINEDLPVVIADPPVDEDDVKYVADALGTFRCHKIPGGLIDDAGGVPEIGHEQI